MSEYNQPGTRVDRTVASRSPPVPTGPLFDSKDIAALIALVIMNLGPLAMAAFWAPYH
jgi:hypothetical protein